MVNAMVNQKVSLPIFLAVASFAVVSFVVVRGRNRLYITDDSVKSA